MAIDNWPLTLPQALLLEGNADAMGDGRIVSNTDDGPGKIRPKSSNMPRPLIGQMRMTSAQVVILEAFVRTTLLKGSLPFMFPDPMTNLPVLCRFTIGALPRWSFEGVRYMVFLNIDVLP